MARRLTTRPRIVVVGSCMLDLIAEVDKPPSSGETVISRRLDVQPGGRIRKLACLPSAW